MADVPQPDPGSVTAEDNCDPDPVVEFFSDVPDGGTCPLTITRTYRAVDDCGNENFCTQLITVDDETPPVLVGCPADVAVECDAVPQPATVTATDNCDPSVDVVMSEEVQTGTPGCPDTYTLVRTWTATDDCGNEATCSQTIEVSDTTPPVMSGLPDPGPFTVECDQIPPRHTGVTATDNCDTDVLIQELENVFEGDCPGEYTLVRTWMASDNCLNNQAFDQTFLVVDNTPPVVTCPDDVQVDCLADVPDPNPGLVTAVDNCDPGPIRFFIGDVQSGSGCPIIIERTYMAADWCGNESYCTQIITIDDQTPPELVGCPQPAVTVECGNVPPVATVTATDDCDGELNVTFAEVTTPGNCPQAYTITRTWTAVDACGNPAECQQVITVEDSTPPEITCPPGATYECIADVPQPNTGLVTADDNCDPSPTVTFVGDVAAGSCPATVTRTYRAVDACDNEAFCDQVFIIDDQTPPVFTEFPDPFDLNQCEPEEVCLDVAAEDPCYGLAILSIVSGPGELVDGQWCYTPTENIATVVTIRATDTCDNYVEEGFSIQFTINSDPLFTNCPTEDQTIHWGETFVYDFEAADPNAEDLTFSLCPDAPASASIDPTTGHFEFHATAEDICDPTICVIVSDECEAADTCEFNLCVTNDPPVITCPGDETVCKGYAFETSVSATDPDNGPYLFYYLVSGPAGLQVDGGTGAITWLDPQPGAWEVCVTATDSAAVCDPCSPANADTCCFTVNVVALDIVIEKVHEQIQGQYTDVSVGFLNQGNNWPVAGFDFLIQYDASALSFLMATEGEFFVDCAWEYFSYRFGANGNCGVGACPSGVLRIIGMAETTGGNLATHPDCYTNDGVADPGPGSTTASDLAVMTFLVTNDRTLECQYVPIRFVWYDCGDNGLSNIAGDTLYISNMVYDYGGEVGDPAVVQWNDITGLDNSMPTVTGAPSPECDISDKLELVRCANFYNGGVDIICADSIDAPGDINLNGISYEIADAVMLTNYFLEGLAAFGGHTDGSVAASDTNRDGVPLTVADLVHIIRVVVGDAHPYAKTTPATAVRADYSIENGVVTVSGSVSMGGAAVVVDGEVAPTTVSMAPRLALWLPRN
jgi:hypothetical protein